MVIFEGDPEMPDPESGHPEGVIRGEFLPSGTDMLIFYREWGEQFPGGSRTHMLSDGAWSNLGIRHMKRIRKVIDSL
jgi:hypothetical protein